MAGAQVPSNIPSSPPSPSLPHSSFSPPSSPLTTHIMASTTPSPVSHLPGPLNINYDSDDDMEVDSDDARHNTNIKETDPDADGESVDDDASPPPSTVNIAGPSLSHHVNSVRFFNISQTCEIPTFRLLSRTRKTRCARVCILNCCFIYS
jgi:hypothetical protein